MVLEKLKELQLNTDRPYRRNSGETIFDLEERFKREMQQNSYYDSLMYKWKRLL